jgi:major vault protein
VLDRKKGTVDLIKGPRMFLPDPRTQVVVRRILDPEIVKLLYPGNQKAIQVNDQLRQLSEGLSVGEHLESREAARAALFATTADRRGRSEEFVGDSFRRGTTYTPPRTVVLDTKYEGAVAVNIWPGYAVLVTNKTGERRVEIGPKMVLLDYDETLMPLELSTGRPKDDRNLLRTVYLRVLNNQVGDLVTVETRDLVKVNVSISYRVNFEGSSAEEQQRWFGVENYVKVLADHARSRMRNAAKRHGIQEFYTNTIDIVREAILGKIPEAGGEKRSGLAFSENGMRVYDVEVLEVSIEDDHVGNLLVRAQSEALSGAIQVSAAEQAAERTKRLEALKREGIEEQEKTAEKQSEVAKKVIGRNLIKQIAEAQSEFQVAQEKQKTLDANLEANRKSEEQKIELARKNATQELERLQKETEEYVKRMGAVSNDMVAALHLFGDKLFVEKVVEAIGPMALATGVTTADIFGQVFKGTPFESVMKALAERPLKIKK